MSADGVDTARSVVKTYVPAYQKDEWEAHAERLDMSQSEFVRTMVQAGRRGFSEGGSEDTPAGDTDGRLPLEDQVIDALSREEYLDWEDLLTALTDDIEARLDDVLEDLQDDNRVRYSGRNGGYTLVDP